MGLAKWYRWSWFHRLHCRRHRRFRRWIDAEYDKWAAK
jgi:hypothetical protein